MSTYIITYTIDILCTCTASLRSASTMKQSHPIHTGFSESAVLLGTCSIFCRDLGHVNSMQIHISAVFTASLGEIPRSPRALETWPSAQLDQVMPRCLLTRTPLSGSFHLGDPVGARGGRVQRIVTGGDIVFFFGGMIGALGC